MNLHLGNFAYGQTAKHVYPGALVEANELVIADIACLLGPMHSRLSRMASMELACIAYSCNHSAN